MRGTTSVVQEGKRYHTRDTPAVWADGMDGKRK
jgi:hypothetical protein